MDHYKVLGIDKKASETEIKKAYFERAKKYHPDAGDQTTIGKFHEVAEAYKILSDPVSKKAYDLSLTPDTTKKESSVSTFSGPSESSLQQKYRAVYRDDELKEFHENRFRKGMFRVAGFTLFFALLGSLTSVIFGGLAWIGAVGGLFIGFHLSMHRNFDLKSFFDSPKKYKTLLFFTYSLFLSGMGYFVFLIIGSFI